ncbi:MAG TPA: hypothetical protein VEC36_03145 [Patescibacteria group bacterium]|nr:hypothetical protein [Patescibacteria group bacterium]
MKKEFSKAEIEAHKAEMSDNYSLEGVKIKPNRFAKKAKNAKTFVIDGDERRELISVALDADVAKVFKTSESINNALRAIISAMPKPQQRGRAQS